VLLHGDYSQWQQQQQSSDEAVRPLTDWLTDDVYKLQLIPAATH